VQAAETVPGEKIMTICYTEATERYPMDCGDNGAQCVKFSAYCYIPLQLPLPNVNAPKTLVTSFGYHVIITTTSSVNRMARRLEGNIGRYTGGGSVTHRGGCGGGVN
jgi:hypothetical protein